MSTALPGVRLDGIEVLVTGAGRGIGRAGAIALAQAGADLTIVSRTAADLAEVGRAVERTGASSTQRVCDVTDPASVAALFESGPPFDVVVGSSGTNIPERFVDVTPEHLEHLINQNIRGTFNVLQAAARQMLARKRGGVLIVVTSQMGHVGDALRTVYCATKHAQVGLVKALSIELAPHGIRTVSVAPTYVKTPMTEPFFEDQAFHADVLARIPIRRIAVPEDIGSVIAFLASPAASMINGASILVDGGWTAR